MKRLAALLVTAFLSLPAHAQNNITKCTSGPTCSTFTAYLDLVFGTAPGTLLQRGPSTWQALTPGTVGTYLVSNGPGQPVAWSNQLYPWGLPTQATNTFLGNVTGGNASPTPVDVSAILNTVGYDVVRPPVPGSILYKDNNNKWQALSWGPVGSVLTARGQAARPDWFPPGILSTNGLGTTSVLSDPRVVCNGIDDDTVGINAVLSSGAKSVFVPAGLVCQTTSGLVVPVRFSWADATIRKLGTSGAKVITVSGDNVTLDGGILDGGNDPTFAAAGIFCQNHSGLTIKNVTTQNFAYEPIYTVDCATGFTADGLNLLGGDSVDGLGSMFMAITADAEDLIIRNSKCNRLGSIATGGQACFDVVGDGSSIIRRFVFTGNGCVGVSTGGTLFQSCLQNINFAQVDTLDGPTISYNRARWCNYCFTFDTLTNGSVVGNTSSNVLTNGYTYEMSNCRNTAFSGNAAEGTMNPPGVLVLLNVANDCVFSGGALKNLSVDPLSAAVDFTSFGSPAGSGNILSGVTIVLAGGTGIVASDTNSVISGVTVRGGVTALNLVDGSGRTVVASVFTGQSGTPIINEHATDIICGNNVGGCKTPTLAVANLPACTASLKGTRYFVNNANATTFNSTVAAGGSNNVPVFCDGISAWKIGANDNIPHWLRRTYA